jgi:hypothetical protein
MQKMSTGCIVESEKSADPPKLVLSNVIAFLVRLRRSFIRHFDHETKIEKLEQMEKEQQFKERNSRVNRVQIDLSANRR